MTTLNNDQHQEPRRKAGTRRKDPSGTPVDKASRKRPAGRRYTVVPDCIHDDEALGSSWDAMQESGGWR